MVSEIIKINNFRIDFSSYNCKNENKIIDIFNKKFIMKKILNINNFKIDINNKKINYSMFYTCPFQLDSNIYQHIKFDDLNILTVKNLCNKIFIRNEKINKGDFKILENIIKKKYKIKQYISIQETFLILWYLIIKDNYIIKSNIIIWIDILFYS